MTKVDVSGGWYHRTDVALPVSLADGEGCEHDPHASSSRTAMPHIPASRYGRNPVEIHGIVATRISATTSIAMYGQMRPSASSLADLAIRQVW